MKIDILTAESDNQEKELEHLNSRPRQITRDKTMMHRVTLSLSCVAVLVLALGSEPLRCGNPRVDISAAEIPPGVTITHGKTTQGFPYLTGGVSSEEREMLEASRKAYDVQLTFAEKSGAYLADVNVVLTDAKEREIVAIKTTGPFLYIQLPPGSYSVSATFQGEMKKSRFIVSQNKAVRQTLVWDLGEQSPDLQK